MKFKILVAFLLMFCNVTLAHDPYDQYKGASGTRCCGLENCIEADVMILPDGSVSIDGAILKLPVGSIHPNPVSERGRWCYYPLLYSPRNPPIASKANIYNTICVFYNLSTF